MFRKSNKLLSSKVIAILLKCLELDSLLADFCPSGFFTTTGSDYFLFEHPFGSNNNGLNASLE